MRQASWARGYDIPAPLLELLFVREFGRLGPLRVPALMAPVSGIVHGPVEAAGWERAWDLALAANAEFPESPELLEEHQEGDGAWVRRYVLGVGVDVEELRSWTHSVRMALTERLAAAPEVIAVEREAPVLAGRAVVVLPVRGEVLEVYGPQRVLVSEELRFDAARYGQRLAELSA